MGVRVRDGFFCRATFSGITELLDELDNLDVTCEEILERLERSSI